MTLDFIIIDDLLMVREHLDRLEAITVEGEKNNDGFTVTIRPANEAEYDLWSRCYDKENT